MTFDTLRAISTKKNSSVQNFQFIMYVLCTWLAVQDGRCVDTHFVVGVDRIGVRVPVSDVVHAKVSDLKTLGSSQSDLKSDEYILACIEIILTVSIEIGSVHSCRRSR